MRARAAATALAIAAALAGAVPAHADRGGIVVSATRSGWTEVTIPEPFQVGRVRVTDVRVRGTFGGFYAVRVDDPVAATPATKATGPADSFSVLVVRRGRHVDTWRTSTHNTVIVNDDDYTAGEFPAGRYRFYVVGDGAFSLRALTSGTNRRVVVQARTPITVMATSAAARARADTLTDLALGFATKTRFGGWYGYEFVATGGAFYGAMCVTPPGLRCGSQPSPIFSGGTDRGEWSTNGFVMHPGEFDPGTWDVATTVTTDVTIERFSTLAIVFEAP